MSNTSQHVSDPFTPTIPEEEVELRSLSRALSFSEGFSLLFARCNQPPQRKRLIDILNKKLPKFTIQEIHFDKPINHLLDELRWMITDPAPDAVFVSGIEYALPVAAEAHATPFVANLNASRNSFSLVVPCPLVLWVPEYVITAIARGAPDFFSVRSGAYYFSTAPHEGTSFGESLVAGSEWESLNLTLSEKQERITTLGNLLAELRSFPSSERDYRTEARLLTRQGTLQHALGLWKEAITAYEQSCALYHKLGDRRGEGLALGNLGLVYRAQSRTEKALASYKQSLAIHRELGDRRHEGLMLGNLGNVYQALGRQDEALSHHEQSLAICREVGDRSGEGNALNNLGNVYQALGRREEALTAYEQGLEIYRKLGDRNSQGITLNNLGNVYTSQGRWPEAISVYEQSLVISRKLGDRIGEGYTLANIARLWQTQADTEVALQFGRQALKILETTEEETIKVKIQQMLAEWERNN